MNMKFKKAGKPLPRVIRATAAALLLTAMLAGCSPVAAPELEEPTSVPPTAVPPTAVQPTAVPPTAVPPTAVPSAVVDPAYYEGEPVAVVPDGEAGKPMVTAAYNTTIRSGPGTNYPVYGAFLGGDTAIAVGVSTDGQWYAISIPVAPGGTGWVSATYVLPEGTEGLAVLPTPPVPPTVELIPPAEGDPQATALVEVYVRTGPGTEYPAYGIAETGATARVIGKNEDGEWLVVRLDPDIVGAGYGWVAVDYTEASNIESVQVVAAPDAPPPVAVAPPPSGVATATAVDYVNLRTGPGTNYTIVGVASPGATGEVSGKSQDGYWWQVKVPVEEVAAGVAWVSADWVYTSKTENVPVVSAPAPPPTEVDTTPPPATSCVLVSQDPADNTTFPTSYGFGMTWVLQNTSDQAWNQGEVDLVFLGALNGQRLHQNWDVYDISQSVQPGENYTVSGGMITPGNPGQYGEAWALQEGSQSLCTFWVIVNAE